MARIRTSNTSVGRPGFRQLIHTGIRRGNKIQKVTRVSVNRKFRKDPQSKSNLNLIGTSQDVLGSTNQRFNLADAPNPTVKRSANFKNVALTRRKSIVPRINRALKKF